MIDAQKLFAALAHMALRGEQLFGRGLVTDKWIGKDLAHRGELRDVLRARINCARRRIDELARGLNLRRHVGKHPLNALKRSDRLTELLTFCCVPNRKIERALREP